MQLRRLLITSLVPFLIQGCAIHPLPDDVTGLPTDIIVRKIRCEARSAVVDNLEDWLKAMPYDVSDNDVGAELQDGRIPWKKFKDTLFTKPVQQIVQKYERTAIAYNFTFDMTEVNNFDANFDFLKAITNATFSSNATAGVDRSRENIRTFTITDTFMGLLTDIDQKFCADFSSEKNYLYPITGDIGLGRMVHDFVNLSFFDNLSGDPAKANGPPTMADTLAFTTKLSGSVTPKIVLTQLVLSDASIAAVASRTDVHKVIVGLSLPVTGSKSVSATKSSNVGLLLTAKGTPAELAAAEAIQQVILRFEIGKSVAVVPTP